MGISVISHARDEKCIKISTRYREGKRPIGRVGVDV
jgi:hypothetical protein